MGREKELVKNTIILSLGNFLPQLMSLITLPILTAFMTKAEFGTYDLINTVVSLIMPIITIRMESAAFRFMIEYRNDQEKSSQVVSSILFFSMFSSIIVTVMSIFIFYPVSLRDKVLIIIYIIFHIVLADLMQIARGYSLNTRFSLAAIINSIVYMFGTILFIQIAQLGLTGVLLSLIVGEIIASLFLAFSIKLNKVFSHQHFSMKMLKEMIQYSWPLVPNSLSLWVMNLSDRLIVTSFLGLEQNAVYTVANKIPSLMGTAQGIFASAWQENASIAISDEDSDEYYSKMFESFICVLTGILSCLIGCSPILFDLIIRGDYGESHPQTAILFAGMFFSAISSFFGGIYVAHKHTKSVGMTTVVAALINFLINICFVKRIGLYAASISTLVSYAILTMYRMYDIQKFQKISYCYKKYLLCLGVVGIMCGIYYVVLLYLNILNFIAGVGIAFLLNRKLVLNIVKGLLKKMMRYTGGS